MAVNKARKVLSSLLFNLLISFAVVVFAISMIIASIGYNQFSTKITEQYEKAAYNAGATGQALIENALKNGGDIDRYIAENEGIKQGKNQPVDECGFTADYAQLLKSLEILCDTQDASMIYVIKLTDEYAEPGLYSTYYSVFDVLTKEDILPSYFAPWAVGAVNLSAQQIKQEDIEVYTNIWRGNLERASLIQLQEKGSDMFDHITSIMPIKNSSGKVTAIICIQQPMQGLRDAREHYMSVVGWVTLGLAAFFVLVSWWYLKTQISKPLKKVASEAERFAQNTTRSEKPLKKTIKSRISEIYTLVESIDGMEKDTLEYIENLDKINAERQKLGAELDVASSIQNAMLPNKFPAFPDRKEFDLFANMTPAKEVGGDFYNYIAIDDDHLLLAIADVSGKGIPAALFMMITMILTNDRAMMGMSPSEIVTTTNDAISAHNEAEMFVTMWLGILEISTGKITAVNAGHDDPAIYRNGKVFELAKEKHGLVVGAMGGLKYKSYEIQLNPGDKLFLYTDGVPEATRSDNAMFDIERMISSLNKRAQMTPKEIIDGVKEDVKAFVGDAPQFDDMTMLCFEYKGAKSGPTLVLDATDANLPSVEEFLEKVLDGQTYSKKAFNHLKIAVEEIYTNVAHYAYRPDVGKVWVTAEYKDNIFKIVIEDKGKPYNPLEQDDPDLSLGVDDRDIGGLGIFMTKKLVDKIDYERVDGKNILKMEKKI